MAEAREKLVQLKVWVPASLHRALKIHAATVGQPMNRVVADAVAALLKRKGAA
jgi:hypothetical protein